MEEKAGMWRKDWDLKVKHCVSFENLDLAEEKKSGLCELGCVESYELQLKEECWLPCLIEGSRCVACSKSNFVVCLID